MGDSHVDKYYAALYKTPEEFAGHAPGARVLILGSGPSTANVLGHKDILKNKFDYIIGVNYTFKHFDGIMDFYMCMEVARAFAPPNPPSPYEELGGKYNKNIPRILNSIGIEKYDQTYNIFKARRRLWDGREKIEIRKYRGKDDGMDSEGLIYGPKLQNWHTGTVLLQAMHFAAILGAAEIYIVGGDLLFATGADHYYGDDVYSNKKIRESKKPGYRVDIVDVMHAGKKFSTIDIFRDSAVTLNNAIETLFNEGAGIKVFDFSNGLITSAIPLKIQSFFGRLK